MSVSVLLLPPISQNLLPRILFHKYISYQWSLSTNLKIRENLCFLSQNIYSVEALKSVTVIKGIMYSSWVIACYLLYLSFEEDLILRKSILITFRSSHRKCSVSCTAERCNFIKIETVAQVFSCEFSEISKNTLFAEHVWRLLLYLLIFNLQ